MQLGPEWSGGTNGLGPLVKEVPPLEGNMDRTWRVLVRRRAEA